LLSGTKVQILTAEELLLDLSPFYLAESKKLLNKYGGVTYVEGAAEAVPSDEQHYDAITCVYLFHELPEVVRTRVVQEWFRVLKPGGKVLFVDMHE
jgi:ubiquinone/menaquinone biosynthesis C-methylase UbiE